MQTQLLEAELKETARDLGRKIAVFETLVGELENEIQELERVIASNAENGDILSAIHGIRGMFKKSDSDKKDPGGVP